MSRFLTQVCAAAVARVAAAAAVEPLAVLRDRASATPVPPAFGAALRGGTVVAEIKRASPSRGVIAAGCDAAIQAGAYADGGAAAISVLTEPEHFHGSLDDLSAVAAVLSLPVLRKDFVVDAYQVWQARAAGAAAVLLLAAALDDDRLAALITTTRAAGVEALIETHDVAEAARVGAVLAALPAPTVAPVVGVNARDLQRLTVDRAVFARVVAVLPDDAVVVAESGVTGADDVARYVADGADAVLVGEHLMVAGDPVAATRALVSAASSPPTSTRSTPDIAPDPLETA